MNQNPVICFGFSVNHRTKKPTESFGHGKGQPAAPRDGVRLFLLADNAKLNILRHDIKRESLNLALSRMTAGDFHSFSSASHGQAFAAVPLWPWKTIYKELI
jgi:hypothetical protein